LGCSIIFWKSKLQRDIAQSTAEAEYYALTTAIKELVPIVEICKEIPVRIALPTTVLVDNQAIIAIANSDKLTRNVKHIRIRRHFVHNEIEYGRIKLQAIPSRENISDILTKPLPRPHFETLRSSIVSDEYCFRRGNEERANP